MQKPTLRRCKVCKQMYLRAYFHDMEDCPGPPEEKKVLTQPKGRKNKK